MIVIARYNENLDWLKSIKIPYIIYNKGNEIDLPNFKLDNVGRESHTYIYHIIKNYDKLDDWTCFLQGDPMYHINFLINEKSFYDFKKGDNFENLNTIWRYDGNSDKLELFNLLEEKINNIYFISHYVSFCDINGFPEHPNLNITKFLNEFFPEEDKNKMIKFSVGAQFIVPKELILKHSKDFYVRLLDYIVNNSESPWVLERLWHLIFKSK